MSPIIKNLHPGWAVIALGTSGVAVSSITVPLPNTAINKYAGLGFIVIAAVLATIAVCTYFIRFIRYRDLMTADIANPGVGALIGAVPSSVLVLTLALAQATVEGYLPTTFGVTLVTTLLAIGLVFAILVGILFFRGVVIHDELPVQMISGIWFIPIVVMMVVPNILYRLVILEPSWASPTITFLAISLWGAGIFLFLLLAAVIGWRLLVAAPPSATMAPSWFIWLAPLGVGGLGLMSITHMLAASISASAGEAIEAMGLLGATAMWGFSLWWLVFSLSIIWTHRANLTVHLGTWGITFPLASFVSLTAQLGRGYDSNLLTWMAGIGWVAVLLVWAWVMAGTIKGVRSGHIKAHG